MKTVETNNQKDISSIFHLAEEGEAERAKI